MGQATPAVLRGSAAPERERPSNLLYAAYEKPPASVGFVNALQHVAVATGGCLPFPVLIGQAAGLPPDVMLNFLSLSFVALGIGALLQCRAGRYFGCGYLVTFVFTAAYLAPSLQAVRLGGLPLLCGMTVFGGMVELLLAQIVSRLRPFFPAEIGIVLGSLGMRLILGIGAASSARIPVDAAWGAVTLALMTGLQVWAKGVLRMLSVIVGMIVGVLVGFALGLYDSHPIAALAGAQLVRLPAWPGLRLSFRDALIVPFVISAAACAMRVMGDITMSQKINDRAWIRPDMANIRKGVTADGFGTMISALLGSIGGDTYSSSVAVANASGVASRFVGFWTGGF